MDLVKTGCAVTSGMTIPGKTDLRRCLLPARKSLIDYVRVWVFAVSAHRGDSCKAGAGGSLQVLCSGSTLGRSAQTWTQRLAQGWTQSSCPAPSHNNGEDERREEPSARERPCEQVSFVQPMVKWVVAHKSYLSLKIPCTSQSRAGACQTHTLSEKLPTIWEQVEQYKRELNKV